MTPTVKTPIFDFVIDRGIPLAGIVLSILAGLFCAHELWRTGISLYAVAIVFCLAILFMCCDMFFTEMPDGPGDDVWPGDSNGRAA